MVIFDIVTVGNMDGSNDVRNPNAVRNPKPTYASVWPQTHRQEAMPTTEERWRNKTE